MNRMKKYSQNRGSTREGAVWQRSLEKFANVDSVLLWPRNIDDRPSTRVSFWFLVTSLPNTYISSIPN